MKSRQLKCQKCGRQFDCKRDLDRHLKKKYPCDEAGFKCDNCGRKLWTKDSKTAHEKICDGNIPTIEDKNSEIQRLNNVIAATSGLNTEILGKRQQIINNNNTQNNITINDIQNVTQNIVILPTGKEDISHLKAIPFENLRPWKFKMPADILRAFPPKRCVKYIKEKSGEQIRTLSRGNKGQGLQNYLRDVKL